MDSQFQTTLRLGLECLPDRAQRVAYIEEVSSQNPQYKKELQELSACFDSDLFPTECLDKVLNGGQASSKKFPGMRWTFREACNQINEVFQNSSTSTEAPFNFAKEVRYYVDPNDYNQKEFNPLEWGVLASVAQFLYRRLPVSWLDLAREELKKNPRFQAISKKYRVPETKPIDLNPRVCANESDWARYDFPLKGVAYRIPVFTPKNTHQPWWLFEDLINTNLETLQLLLVPRDLERMLHPEGRPDLAIFLSGDAHETYRKCGLNSKTASGEYHPEDNGINFSTTIWHLHVLEDEEKESRTILKKSLNPTFFHEWGHAIYYLLLDEDARAAVGALHQWTREQVGGDQKKFYYFPDPTSLWEGKPYSAKNEGEFFAEWIEEFVRTEASGEKPSDPYGKARHRILKNLFSTSGIHLPALSKEGIQNAYQSEGIAMSLKKKGWIFPLKIGAQYFTFPHQGQDLSVLEPFLEMAAGYRVKDRPGGWIWGGGLALGATLKGNAFGRDGAGALYPVPVQAYDFGIWGLIGYGFPRLQVHLEPTVAYRILRVDSENKDAVSLGADAGFSLKKIPVGLSARYRFLPGMGHQIGGYIQVDFSSF